MSKHARAKASAKEPPLRLPTAADRRAVKKHTLAVVRELARLSRELSRVVGGLDEQTPEELIVPVPGPHAVAQELADALLALAGIAKKAATTSATSSALRAHCAKVAKTFARRIKNSEP